MNFFYIVDEKVNIIQIWPYVYTQIFNILDPSMNTGRISRFWIILLQSFWILLSYFFVEKLIHLMIQISKEIWLFVSHGAVDVNIFNLCLFKQFFQKSSFTCCSGTIKKYIDFRLKIPFHDDIIRNHFESKKLLS